MAITTQTGAGRAGLTAAVGIAKEVTYGTAVTPGTYIKVTDITGFEGKNKLVNSQGIRQSVDNPAPGVGSFEISPSFGFEVDPDNIGLILGLILGKDVLTGSSAPYTHTVQLTPGSPRLSTSTLTTDLGFGGTTSYAAVGNKIAQLDLTCKSGSFLTAKVQMNGKTVAGNAASITSPSFSAANPFEFAHLAGASSCLLNGVGINLNDFTLNLKQGLKPHMGSVGGRTASSIDETTFTCEGSFTLNTTDQSIDSILWGAATAPASGYIAPVPFVINFTHSQIAGGSTPYSLQLALGAIVLTEAPKTVKRGDTITTAVKFIANETVANALDSFKAVIVNAASVAYL
jgi:hypothetical protein